MPRIARPGRALAACMLFVAAACGGDGPTPPPQRAAVASVTVESPAAFVAMAGTVQLSAVLRDAAGNALTGRDVQWSTGSAAVATVSAAGVVTGVAGGEVTITATSEGKSGSLKLTVTVPVARVVVEPGDFGTRPGLATQLTATAYDPAGAVLTGRAVAWSTTAPSVATVSAAGLVTAVANGEARIIAASEGQADTVTVTVSTPQALRFRAVTAGDLHSCGITSMDGSAWCWGMNQAGQLGTQTAERCQTSGGTAPCSTRPVAVSGALRFIAIDAGTGSGSGHTCAIDTAGKAWCWGSNSNGQLGDGNRQTSSAAPRAVAGNLTFTAISAGTGFTCAVALGGDLYCWGTNFRGQLGTGNPFGDDFPTPQKVAGGAKYVRVSAGQGFACAITTAGQYQCWGDVPGSTPRRAPDGGGTAAWVSAGLGDVGEHYCTVSPAGQVFCTSEFGNAPPPAALGAVSTVHSGALFDCALKTDGAAFCWGANDAGQLGSAAGGDVEGGLRFASMDAGWHSCAVTAEGIAYCWGRNDFGQLGGDTGETCARVNDTPLACSRRPFKVAGQD